jgi:RNA-binding protein YhbY
MNIDQLSEKNLKRVNSDINKVLNDKEISEKRLGIIIPALAEDGVVIDEKGYNDYLKDMAGVLEERTAIFNPKEGLGKYFAINKQPLSALATRGTRKEINDEVAKRIAERGVSLINLTQDALENKQMIIDTLESALDNENIKGGKTLPFSDDELQLIRGLIDKLKSVDESKEYALKESDWEQLKNVSQNMSKVQVIKVQAREEYYNYWEGIHREYDDFHDYIVSIQPALNELLDQLIELGVKKEVEKELGTALESVILPNYIFKVRPVPREELDEESKALKITYDFLSFIGAQIPDRLSQYRKIEDLQAQAEATLREEAAFDEAGNPLQGGGGASFDEEAVNALAVAIDELEEQEVKATVYFDPLFAILAMQNEKTSDFTPQVIERAKEEIKQVFRGNEDSEYFDDIEQLIDNQISSFLKQYEDATVAAGESFYLPMFDDDNIVSMFTELNVQVEVESSKESDEIVRETMTYAKAVEYVNRETKGFFRTIGRILEITRGTIAMSKKSTTPKGGGGGEEGQDMVWLGGTQIELPVKISEVNAERLQDLDNLTEKLEEYYMKPLGSKYVLLGDLPEFFSSFQFRDIFTHLKGTRKQQVKQALRQQYVPFIKSQDYGRIMDFLDVFKDVNAQYINSNLIQIFEDALISFVKFWEIVNNVAKETDEAPTETITREIKTVMGALLYEIAYDSLSGNEEKIDSWKWRKQPLSYWKKQQEENNYTIENLLVLLEDPDWKIFIESNMASDLQLRRKHEQLISMLKKPIMKLTGPVTNAMLHATDIIRKMNGLRIYNGKLDITDIDDLSYVINLIKKENKVDIYGVDIYNIVKSQTSFNSLATDYGISQEIIYKIKGLFR